jgi:tRNA threonylcarbamoyladenosine biosynthesis protein TsaB
MITLAIDTCESRGSVAFRRDGRLAILSKHDSETDYSSWLLPAVKEVLRQAATDMRGADLLAVATGPGSFTGLRVGLTAVKAWAEVTGKALIGVSRLAAMSKGARAMAGYTAACYDAQRGHMFLGLYKCKGQDLELMDNEMVIRPEDALALVTERAGTQAVHWVSLDPEMLTGLEGWREREGRGDTIVQRQGDLANAIGEMAEALASEKVFTDPLQLDANYVRRSDAEIFWKGPATHVG